MLNVIARCDYHKCTSGVDDSPKEKGFCHASIIPESPAIHNILQKMGWIITDTKQFCSWKCQEDYEIQCEHKVVDKSGYKQCIYCGKVWQPDYDSMLEGN